jgi:formylglycine-generating enzyme required for sulfatase activity
MAEKELKQQLDDLFSELEELANADESAVVDEEGSLFQLAGLFSDLEASLETIEPPTKPVGEHRQDLPPPTQVQSQWDVESMLQVAADNDPAVARLALDALLQMGDTANRYVLSLAQQPDAPLHRGGEAYLSRLLGQPFVFIPPGPFLIGSHPRVDEMANADEQPQHELSLTGYWIGRYPVTTASFQAFVNAGGYRRGRAGDLHGDKNQPGVNVTWYDALAYCRWLSEGSGLLVTLPSEAEWEKAARGTDGRRYPWGNHPPTAELCNFQRSTPVGQYSPQGDSPYGCADMVGNVWEWTRSAYRAYPYNPADGREELTGEDVRAIRGVTFNNNARLTRCAFRYRLTPNLCLPILGFRVIVSPLYL